LAILECFYKIDQEVAFLIFHDYPIIIFIYMKYYFRVIGVIFIISPLFLYWLIHGSVDLYKRVINGPFPLSHLGSAPVQLVVDVWLFIIGVIILSLG